MKQNERPVGNHWKTWERERLDTKETSSKRMRTRDRHRWEKEIKAKDVRARQGTDKQDKSEEKN